MSFFVPKSRFITPESSFLGPESRFLGPESSFLGLDDDLQELFFWRNATDDEVII